MRSGLQSFSEHSERHGWRVTVDVLVSREIYNLNWTWHRIHRHAGREQVFQKGSDLIVCRGALLLALLYDVYGSNL